MSSPTHPKARPFLDSRIFDRLKSFRQFEKRIAALPTAHERGAAFEVFAEAYLATLAVEKAQQVWSGSRVPPSLRKRLALTLGDYGVDGVFETPLGAYHAYQAKFRTGRPSLTWDELSTFIGLADRADQRVLITNCDRFSDVVKQRTGFYAITGNDLDKLTPRDFATIRTWLEGAKVERTPKHPLPHQDEALGNILSALREHDRATALMACGTGKTLVALWTAEKLGAQRILVLVPSLALLRQILHEWAREASWPSFAHLCVCSDPTVKPGTDELFLRATDLDFPVTTDPRQVRNFLAADFDGVKLVFATYQSAHVVAAGMRKRDAFDLAIFDEAHKTAGREGVHFSFALSDKNLPIRKRLFLTATPRHFDIRRRDKEGDARLVYSMDAPEVYGPVAHQLTFAEAARRRIICDYKVVISVVTSDMVNDHLLRHGEVIVKGDAVKARHVAIQLALHAAVAQHGVGKIFTFHRSVASAAAFTGDGSEGIVNHLPGFDAFHVNGAMPTSERENIMTEFRAAPRAVISNARCLTEGVDVPAVDMVAFLTPKRSRVDIVQATGRAMRKAPGKTTGYVLVPLFVEQAKGETIEEALARTGFDEIWNVLQAMQEQDETLAEIIRQMREERGRTKGFNDSRFRERVEFLGPQISLEALRESITTACVEVLGDNWDERFGELEAFKKQHGHCKVPDRCPENPPLGKWVRNQRVRRHTLNSDRLARLERIGFDWNPFRTEWDAKYSELKRYKEIHGDCDVPQSFPENPGLGVWCNGQRNLYNTARLNKDRIRRLSSLGFVWKPIDTRWERRFAQLQQYRALHGDCGVPDKWKGNPQLANWVGMQRAAKNKGTLVADRISRLEAIGFIWDPHQPIWESLFSRLVAFKAGHGHCNVPAQWPDDPKLGVWVAEQKSAKRTGHCREDRVARLDEIGFVWDALAAMWEERFSELEQYKVVYGHCEVPQNWPDNPSLGLWCNTQRQYKKKDKLPDERVRRLESIGFVWEPNDAVEKKMLAALFAFHTKHGHCNVPRGWRENPQLAGWCSHQRQLKRRGSLSEALTRQLDEIAFVWNARQDFWEEMFAALSAYKAAHGNCDVPQAWRENRRLGQWCSNQREAKKMGKLSGNQIRRLDCVGFRWSTKEVLTANEPRKI